MKVRSLVQLVLCVALAYAIARYHLLKGVPWAQFPLYVLNKVTAVAGLVFVGAAPFRRAIDERKTLGNLGAALVAGHLVASLLILDPSYFAKFYVTGDDGRTVMTWRAETSMLAGVVGSILLGVLCVASSRTAADDQPRRRSLVPGLGRWILVATAAHVLFMGYAGWWPVSHWASAGYLPPITLLSFLLACGFVAARFVRSRPRRVVADRRPFEQEEQRPAATPGAPR